MLAEEGTPRSVSPNACESCVVMSSSSRRQRGMGAASRKTQAATPEQVVATSVKTVAVNLEKAVENAEKRFSRKVVLASSTLEGGKILGTDPRLLDYVYETAFTATHEKPSSSDTTRKQQKADPKDLRLEVFSSDDYKAAADLVAYNEDLVTREVSLLEGVTRCKLCGSNNTTVAMRHTRSSDEAPIMMIYCGSCNHRTNQSGE